MRVPIFLDFEGVLKTVHSPIQQGFILARNLVEPLSEAEALGLLPQIVIASTYRRELSVGALAQLLEREAPGLGRFVASATPTDSELSLDREGRRIHALAPRLFEIRSWLTQHGFLGAPWIAIDDTPSLYGPESMPAPAQLLVCDSALGFNAERAAALIDRLASIARSVSPATGSPALSRPGGNPAV